MIQLKLKSAIDQVGAYLGTRILLKRLVGGALWSLIGGILTRLFAMLTNIAIARMLGREDFGAYGILVSTLETFSLFGGLALGFTIIKFTAEYRKSDPKKAGIFIGAAVMLSYGSAALIAASLFLLSNHLAGTVLNRPDLGGLLRIGAFYMFVRTVNNIQLGSLAGLEAFRETAKINAITGLLTPAMTIPAVYFLDLTGAMFSLVSVSFIGYAYCRKVFKSKCTAYGIKVKFMNREALTAIRPVLSFAIPAFLSGVMLIPVSWLSNAILAQQPNGYNELGNFNAANQWRQFVIFIPTTMSAAMLAITSDTFANKGRAAYRQAYFMNMKLIWSYALPATVLTVMFGGPLNRLFGEKFMGAEVLIAPLIVAAFFSVLNTAASPTVTGAGRMKADLAINSIWAMLMLGTSFWLIPSYRAMGLAWATLFAGMGYATLRIVYIDRKLIPGSLAEFRLLILLSVMTLSPLVILTGNGKFNIYWGFFLTLLSAIPLLQKILRILMPKGLKATSIS